MNFADILREHWPHYVAQAEGPIPPNHWRAVEAVLSCRTPRRGGHLYHCPDCSRTGYQFHSCNHRSCPQCGATDQQHWSAVQEARLLPVSYYLVTFTVPEALRRHCLRHPREFYNTLLTQSAQALRDLLREPKYLGGECGFIAVLQTWTRRLLHHPHVHVLIPAVGLSHDGCQLVRPPSDEFLVHVQALSARICHLFAERMLSHHPELHRQIDPGVWQEEWVTDCRPAGRGRCALRYLAAYVARSAFKESRLCGYDQRGRLLLRYKDSADAKWKSQAIRPHELIRRWLLHVLPKGFVAIRHFGFLSPAAVRTLRRVRFLLGRTAVSKPSRPIFTMPCPCCQRPMQLVARIPAVRGPPLCRQLPFAA